MIYRDTKFHMHNSIRSFVTAVKFKVICKLHAAAMLKFYVMLKTKFNKCFMLCEAAYIFNLSSMLEWAVSFTLRLLYHGKGPSVSLSTE
jgi:hypothetical protein